MEDRIRKLLALAKDQAGTPEGRTAAKLARELMRKMALEEDRLGTGEVDPIGTHRFDLLEDARWCRKLASLIARHCECMAAFERGAARGAFYGHRSGTLVAEYLYAVMYREIADARDAFVAEREARLEAAYLASQANGFCYSALQAVEHRLANVREQEPGEAGYALVRARRPQVKAWLARQDITFRIDPPRVYPFSKEGYETGRRIPLHEALE